MNLCACLVNSLCHPQEVFSSARTVQIQFYAMMGLIILERDFVQSIETGLRILVNGATNQQDQQGLEDILTPLTLQLLNLGFRHDSPLNVRDLLFEAATLAIG
uniref:LisH domain and HEAT repeat-containing protein KIAA1468 homolog n=1 Tax=Caenorhabditis tropicalis TaxID=1561998 RepID=A0A1I7U203_9PELO